jgi:hypothetical protein
MTTAVTVGLLWLGSPSDSVQLPGVTVTVTEAWPAAMTLASRRGLQKRDPNKQSTANNVLTKHARQPQHRTLAHTA